MAVILLDQKGAPVKRNGKDVLVSDSTAVIKAVDLEKRTMVIKGTDETVDRMGDIITMSGWNVANYLKNPVFLWAHDYHSVPIAATRRLIRQRDPKAMIFHLRFPTKGMFPFADMILNLYAEKIINASSVGMIAEEWEYIGEEPKPGHWSRGRKFTKQELLELSGCPVPANPNALQEAFKAFGGPDKLLESVYAPEKKAEILGELQVKTSYEEEGPTQVQVPESFQCEFDDEEVPKAEEAPVEEAKAEEVPKEEPCEECGDLPEEQVVPPYDEKDAFPLADVEKPYPNEHACRLEEPGQFKRFARQNCKIKSDGKCIDFIFGYPEGEGGGKLQAMRYPKKSWDAAAAKSHCKSHKGSFEAAKESSEEEVSLTLMGAQSVVDFMNTNLEKIKGLLDKPDTKEFNEGLATDLALRIQSIEGIIKSLSEDIKTLKSSLESRVAGQVTNITNVQPDAEAIKGIASQLADAFKVLKGGKPASSVEPQAADTVSEVGVAQLMQEVTKLKIELDKFKS